MLSKDDTNEKGKKERFATEANEDEVQQKKTYRSMHIKLFIPRFNAAFTTSLRSISYYFNLKSVTAH